MIKEWASQRGLKELIDTLWNVNNIEETNTEENKAEN